MRCISRTFTTGSRSLFLYTGDNSVNLSFSAAEGRASALVQSFAMFDDDHPDIMKHIKTEAETREQLADTTKRLERYQSIYGDPSQLPSDIQSMEELLRSKEEEIERLRLVDKQRSQVSVARMTRRHPF